MTRNSGSSSPPVPDSGPPGWAAIAARAGSIAPAWPATFGDGPSGIYRIKVGPEWYSWSQFQSIDARAAFPSFDEPGYKTPFTISITTKPGFVALSNAPEVGKGTPAGELVTDLTVEFDPHAAPLLRLVARSRASIPDRRGKSSRIRG